MLNTYQTSRLHVYEVTQASLTENKHEFLQSVIRIMTPAVTENLPRYFHNLHIEADAKEPANKSKTPLACRAILAARSGL